MTQSCKFGTGMPTKFIVHCNEVENKDKHKLV